MTYRDYKSNATNSPYSRFQSIPELEINITPLSSPCSGNQYELQKTIMRELNLKSLAEAEIYLCGMTIARSLVDEGLIEKSKLISKRDLFPRLLGKDKKKAVRILEKILED
ncbi:MAG: hypothetical protein KJ559_03280 [Nanoarchaeota archaeon]|nr:hypothetical protein [Nanoarchaeota archaeon]